MVRLTSKLVLSLAFATFAGDLPAQGVASGRALGLKEELSSYTAILKAKDNRKGRRDGEAIALMKEIMGRFDTMVDKDRRLVTKALFDSFRFARRTAASSTLYFDVVANLARTEEQGAAPLRKLFHHKRIAKGKPKDRKQWFPLRVKMLEGLGKCRDAKCVDFLLEVAMRNAESDLFLAAAGRALGEYDQTAESVRKHIAQKLIRELNRVFGIAFGNRTGKGAEYDIQTPTFRKRYQAIRAPWTAALQRLTRQTLSEPSEWQRFWNKNKGRRWEPASSAKKKRGRKRD